MGRRQTERARQARALPRTVASVALAGRAVPLSVRRSRRARHLSLRLDPDGDAVELILPRGVPLEEGMRFVEEKSGWILTRLATRPPRVPFAPGAAIPYLGVDHVICHRPEARGGVWREGNTLAVSGRAEFLARRLRDWLKREALRLLDERARAHAARVGRSVARVGMRDPKTRWGSCSPNGALTFSWRLVLAPEWVLDYVVAHEVAHLVHAHHGPRFWRLVDRLTPEVEAARAWLRRHGDRLLRYG